MSMIWVGDTSYQSQGPVEYQRNQFELETAQMRYRGGRDQLSAFLAWADAHMNAAMSTDAGMFLTGYSIDSDKTFPTVSLQYSGRKDGVVPPGKIEYSNAPGSASSHTNKYGTTLSQPLTATYYANTLAFTWLTANAPGNAGVSCPNPSSEIEIIKVEVNDVSFAITSLHIAELVDMFFTKQMTTTFQASELVKNKWWQNQVRKTINLSPWIFAVTTGDVIGLFSAGVGYSVGDNLTITDGVKSALIQVTNLGVSGSITDFTIVSNTFTYTKYMLMANGGTGTGAGFNAVHLS